MLAAFAAAHGLDTLGRLTTGPRPVLYLALEDTRRRYRYRDRALKLLASLNTSPASTFDLRTSSPRASAGGLKLIEDWLKQNPGGLVVVDTLAKFRDPSKGRKNCPLPDRTEAARRELLDIPTSRTPEPPES